VATNCTSSAASAASGVTPIILPTRPRAADIAEWAADLARIRAVARRRRLLGRPDAILEAGCAILERRLAEMRMEART